MSTSYVGPGGQWITVTDTPAASAGLTPITVTAGEAAAPTAAMLANVWATYQLNVAPYTRYQSTGSAFVAFTVA
jgi:hypothetical protein